VTPPSVVIPKEELGYLLISVTGPLGLPCGSRHKGTLTLEATSLAAQTIDLDITATCETKASEAPNVW